MDLGFLDLCLGGRGLVTGRGLGLVLGLVVVLMWLMMVLVVVVEVLSVMAWLVVWFPILIHLSSLYLELLAVCLRSGFRISWTFSILT